MYKIDRLTRSLAGVARSSRSSITGRAQLRHTNSSAERARRNIV